MSNIRKKSQELGKKRLRIEKKDNSYNPKSIERNCVMENFALIRPPSLSVWVREIGEHTFTWGPNLHDAIEIL